MILLKSIPLSLGVFWRYLIVMVVLLPATTIVNLVAGIIPILNLILFPVVSVAVQAFVTLVGFRIAFQAAGSYSAPVFGRLVVGAIKWGMLQLLIYGFVMMLLAVFAAGAFWTIKDQFAALGPQPTPGEMIDLLTASPAILTVVGIALATYLFVSTILVVPMAATAYSAGNKSTQYPLFWGTGAGFFSILFCTLAGIAIVFFAGAVGLLLTLYAHLLDAGQAAAQGKSPQWLTQREYLFIVGAVLLYLWAYCWWYAVGALAFLKKQEQVEKRIVAERPTAPQHQVDLSELRRSRTQPRPGWPH